MDTIVISNSEDSLKSLFDPSAMKEFDKGAILGEKATRKNYSTTGSSAKQTKMASNHIRQQMKAFRSQNKNFTSSDCQGDLEKLCFYRIKFRTGENIIKALRKEKADTQKQTETTNFGNVPSSLKTIKNDSYDKNFNDYLKNGKVNAKMREMTRKTVRKDVKISERRVFDDRKHGRKRDRDYRSMSREKRPRFDDRSRRTGSRRRDYR